MKLSNPMKVIFAVLSVLFIAIIIVCIYTFSIFTALTQTDIDPAASAKTEIVQDASSQANGPTPESEKSAVQNTTPLDKGLIPGTGNLEDDGITNIALFGLDGIGTEVCRSDTIIIATIDRENKKVKLTSLMRDLYVEIPGKWKDRINAAYAYGGPALAIDTINKNFNLDIRYFATADFNGMKYLIDVLGGVEINIKEGEIPHINSASINQIKTAGLQHLDGQQTLAYTRIRYFGNSDYERTERQRTVLSQLYDKAKSAGVLKLGDIFSSVLPYVETNLSREDIMNLALACYSFTGSAELYRIPADGTFSEETVQNKAVLVPNLNKNTELLHKFIYNED